MNSKWNETYPRPQLVRDEWMGLNGIWRFGVVRAQDTISSDELTEAINVPFCPESRLSGIERRIPYGSKMVYERDFAVPEEWEGRRILLHFGAVDQKARVFIDGKEAGSHEGGYLPFTLDITDLLRSGELREDGEAISDEYADGEDPAEENAGGEEAAGSEKDADGEETADSEKDAACEETADSEAPAHESLDLDWSDNTLSDGVEMHVLRVEAVDDLDHRYPWGKQKNSNGGMWYTPVSGIWQSVWIEPAAEEHITSLKIDCGPDWVEIRAFGIDEGEITLLGERYSMAKDEGSEEKCASIHVKIRHPHMWSPEDPHLYDFAVETLGGDRVRSYFALRTLTIEERDGYKRLCLNGEPYFFNGLLDQGYWQDGIYTPESPDKYAGDILAMKSLGFNTLRKHIKIENELFYYECDRLGMAVFQDMVNNSDYSFIHDTALPTIGLKNFNDTRAHRGVSRKLFLESMDETVRLLYDHPSVCYWTIFNEGWGQFAADEAYERLRTLDSSRFIDSTSGWFWQSKSDVDSHHVYFKPVDLKAGDRPLVLSEFGGYACKIPDHCFNKDKTYGYRKCADEAALLGDLARLYENEILPLIGKGLCAAIYTQLSDVEDETNGILTYDREIIKFRSYTGTDSIILLGRHTEQQGGKVIASPGSGVIRAYVAENHSNVIRVFAGGDGVSEVSVTDRNELIKGTRAAAMTGMLEGFIDLFGSFDGEGKGLDIHVRIGTGAEEPRDPLNAFSMLMCRIINERYYRGRADAVELARIAHFAGREYLGSSGGMAGMIAIGTGKPVLIDFSRNEPEIRELEEDLKKAGCRIDTAAGQHNAAGDPGSSAIIDEMSEAASALGAGKLSDLNDEQFRRKLSALNRKAGRGGLTENQIQSAKLFYEENECVLAAEAALRAGNSEKFMQYIGQAHSRAGS